MPFMLSSRAEKKEKNPTIHYDASIETDIFDYFEDDDPYKNIQIT